MIKNGSIKLIYKYVPLMLHPLSTTVLGRAKSKDGKEQFNHPLSDGREVRISAFGPIFVKTNFFRVFVSVYRLITEWFIIWSNVASSP